MKHLILTIAAVLLGLGTMAAQQAKHHEYTFGHFTEIVNNDDLNIDYVSLPDSAGLVSFEAPDAVASHIMFNHNKGKLTVMIDLTSLPEGQEMPTVRIYADSLSQVVNDGVGTVTINDPRATTEFKATLSDNGRIVLNGLHSAKASLKIVTGKGTIIANGDTKTLHCSNLGTGTIDALNLGAKLVSCRLVGTGNIWVNCPDAPLTVSGAGTGTVSYRGTPLKITKRKIGPMKIIPHEDK